MLTKRRFFGSIEILNAPRRVPTYALPFDLLSMPSNEENKQEKPITVQVKEILEVFSQIKTREVHEHEPKIVVNDVASRLAFFYEKIRNSVDYKEEHLLRKNAIKRILKRILFIENRKQDLGKFLIKELIRARYLPNHSIPESKAAEIEAIILQYIHLCNHLPEWNNKQGHVDKVVSAGREVLLPGWLDWLFGIAACQIEESFFPRLKEEAVVELMQRAMLEKIYFSEELISVDEMNFHLNIAIRRSLIKADSDLLRYFILRMYYPEWFNGEDDEALITEISSNISSLIQWTHHPLQEYLFHICKKNLAPFLVIEDIFKMEVDKVKELLGDSERLEQKIREYSKSRYSLIAERLRRSAVRSVIYIFITKIAIALLLEVPYELKYLKEVNYITLGINMLFPPFLMLISVINVKAPSEKNTQKIIWEIMKVFYQHEATVEKDENNAVYKIKPSVFKKERFLDIVFQIFYTIMFIMPLFIVVKVLMRLDFNILSGAIFIVFLSTISFFATRLRLIARELLVVDNKEGIFAIIQDFFSLPFIRFGRWLSLRFSRINVFVFILDFIIEAPFKTFIEIFEQWISFLRKKREEIY